MLPADSDYEVVLRFEPDHPRTSMRVAITAASPEPLPTWKSVLLQQVISEEPPVATRNRQISDIELICHRRLLQ